MTISLKSWRHWGLILITLSFLFCGKDKAAQVSGSLHVISYGPTQEWSAEQPLQIVFNQPMVKADKLGQKIERPLLHITPAARGSYVWQDAQTLIFSPSTKISPSTRYNFSLSSELLAPFGEKLAEDISFSVTTPRLKISWQTEQTRWLPQQPVFTLIFNQPIKHQDVLRECAVYHQPIWRTELEVNEPAHTDDQGVTTLKLKPKKQLERGLDYQLRCNAVLSGSAGSLGMNKEAAFDFQTLGDLAVVSFEPAQDKKQKPESTTIKICFNNPLPSAVDWSKFLITQPPIADFKRLYADDGFGKKICYSAYRVVVAGGANYQVQLKAGLKDNFGQPLAKDENFKFSTGDFSPNLSAPHGFFVIEKKLANNQVQLPYSAINLPRFTAKIAMLNEAQFVPAFYQLERGAISQTAKSTPAAFAWNVTKQVDSSSALNERVSRKINFEELTAPTKSASMYAVKLSSEAVAQETREYDSWRYMLFNHTDLGIIVKLGRASGLAWVVSLREGKTVAGARINFRGQDNRLLFSGQTNNDGVLMTPGSYELLPVRQNSSDSASTEFYEPPYADNESPKEMFVTAQHGDDWAVVKGHWDNGLERWNFGLPQTSDAAYEADYSRLRGFMQTDRGLYRPGETVHVRGLVRQLQPAAGLRVPLQRKAIVRIIDPLHQEHSRYEMEISEFGGFSVDVPLNQQARLGDYQVVTSLLGTKRQTIFRDRFMVEEYRPAAFEIELKPQSQNYQLGQRAKVTARANYLFSGPVSQGKVAFTVRTRPTLVDFREFEGFYFDSESPNVGYYEGDGDVGRSELVFETEIPLDAQGQALLDFELSSGVGKKMRSQDFLISATVKDRSNQALTKSMALTAHLADFYLGIKPERFSQSAGQPITFKAVAVDVLGKPRAIDAELIVSQRQWRMEKVLVGDHEEEQYKPVDTPLEQKKISLKAGINNLSLIPKQGGELVISLRAKQQVSTSAIVWVESSLQESFRRTASLVFPLIADKKRYQPGETAQLLAQPLQKRGLALFTVERDGVLAYQLKEVNQGSLSFALPLGQEHMPNVYASVTVATGRSQQKSQQDGPTMGMGITALEVDSQAKSLQVQVKTERATYRPGEKVNAELLVKDSQGLPVEAELAVAAADEGVLQLIGYQTPNPLTNFFMAYPLGVQTSGNFTKMAWNTLRLEGYYHFDEREGADGGGKADQVRRKFVSTAFWAPQVRTNSAGKAQISFIAPDNLTAYRLMAVAASQRDNFGSGETRLTVAKPLQAQPLLPRFLVGGDLIQAGVLIHNRTSQSGQVEIKAQAQGAVLKSAASQQVMLKAYDTKPVLFSWLASKSPEAIFKFSATLGTNKDLVEEKVPIKSPAIVENKIIKEGILKTAAPASIKLITEEEIQHGRFTSEEKFELLLDFTGMSQLEESLRYLIEYPHGCLEQTVDKVVPMLKVEKLIQTLDIKDISGSRLKDYIEAGIAKILRHQHGDGAFSLWPSSEPDTFITAYGLWGLLQAKASGYHVPEQALVNALRELRSRIRLNEGKSHRWYSEYGAAGEKAFALWVLAQGGYFEHEEMNKFYEQREKLPLFGQALLAAAMQKDGKFRELPRQLLAEILKSAHTVAGDPRRWIMTEPNTKKLEYYFSSDTRTTALVLWAALQIIPRSEKVGFLAQGLLSLRERSGRFSNTQENMFSLLSLAQYLELSKQQATAPVTISLSAPGLTENKLSLDPKKELVKRLVWPRAAKLESGLRLNLNRGEIHFSLRQKGTVKLQASSKISRGFTLSRQYFDDRTGQAKTEFRVGDVLRIELSGRAENDGAHAVLVDYLPAGFEPLNPRLTGATDSAEQNQNQPYYYEWSNLELHDDRVAVFGDWLSAGTPFNFSYRVRATSAGTFALPAAMIEKMYAPSTFGRTDSSLINILSAR